MLNSYFLRPFILPACVLLQKKGLLPGDIGNSSTDSKPRHSPAQKAIDNNMAEAADPANHHTQAIFKNGRFQNPWPNYLEHTAKDIISLIRTKDLSNIPSKAELDETLPIVTPNFSEFNSSPACGVRVMWLGHASVLVQFDDVTVLTDPIFSPYCSPVSRIGPKRYRDPPCCVMDLPKVDAVVISHNHYDHLDVQSVKSLVKKFGEELMWYVPMGLASWMRDCGCKNVVELTWWDSATLPGRDDVRFVATPSKHWCNRGVFDRNKVLWASWAVIGPRHRFYFGGDTGYCAGFAEIGREFGPFDLAAIPIGAYYPRSFMESIHVNPDEAVKIHHDLNSKASIGIHWGTFKMTSEYYLEPKERLADIIREQKMPPNSFVTLKHGEIHIVGGDSYRDVD